MISTRFASIYGWVTLSILVILLVLVLTESVDRSLQLPILIFAGSLVVSRVILRNMVRKQEEKKTEPKESE
ncbi:MAG: hypothetical protein OEV30_09820 [Ignavibacteria bacterium]|nr:hypothetical protein [Ignavibacteria bacterium]